MSGFKWHPGRILRQFLYRRVTQSEVEEKLREIAADKPFIVFDPFLLVEMGHDIERGLIYINPELTSVRVNMLLERFPEADWEEMLERMVRHELVHKNQGEYLRGCGLSIEEIDSPEMHYAKEFHALNEVPFLWEEIEYFRQELRTMSPEELEDILRVPSSWVMAAYSLSEDEIKRIFGPLGADVSTIHLKNVGRKILTKEDIIRYAPEFRRYMEHR
jgi:hypothetical protein